MKQMNPALIALSLSLLCGRMPVAAQVGIHAPTGPSRISNVPAISNGLTPSAGLSAQYSTSHGIYEMLLTPAPTQVSPTEAPSPVSLNASDVKPVAVADKPNAVTRTHGTHSPKKHARGLEEARKASGSQMMTLSEQAKHTIEEGTADWPKPEPGYMTGQTRKGDTGLAKPTAPDAALSGPATPVPAAAHAAQQEPVFTIGDGLVDGLTVSLLAAGMIWLANIPLPIIIGVLSVATLILIFGWLVLKTHNGPFHHHRRRRRRRHYY